jgi:ribosomal protein L14
MKTKTPYVKLLHSIFVFVFLAASNSLFSQTLLLQSSFEGSNPFAGFTNNQSCCSYSVTASTAHAHDGTQSYKSEVRVGDPSVSSGWRAELTTPNIQDQGDMWYGFSIYFENPVSGQYWSGSYGGHFLQWHPGNGSGSAELSLWGSDGLWDVCVNPTGQAGVIHQNKTAAGGALQKITANVWHDVVFHVNWATSGGMVEVWIDGTLYFTQSNLNWLSGPYLKFGMNRWGDCSGGAPCDTWTIYYDNIKIGRNVNYAAVAPSTSTTPANQSPTANAGNNITMTLPTNSATLSGSGTDPDGTIASYAWSRVSGPTTFTFGTANGGLMPLTGLVAGTYVFRLTVTDNGGATATDDVTVTVSAPVNLPPTANAGSDITMTLPTNSTSLVGSGTDADGTISTYAWTRVSGPTTYTLGAPGSSTSPLSNLVAGNYVFRLTVTDNNGATATDNVTVIVNAPANQAPTANAGSDITMTLPTNSANLVGSGSDVDGTITGYAWTRVSGPTTYTLGAANSSTTSLSNLVAGTYVFKLTVTDNGGATAADNITIIVNPATNQAPTANAGSDITLTLPNNSTNLLGSGSDADGTISTYAWSRVSGPTTYTLGAANASTTSLSGLIAGTYVFKLTVTDNSGATGSDNVTITVLAAPNQAPTANAGNNITITLPTNSTNLVGSGTDADGTISTYAWTRVSGPTTYTLGAANASTSPLSNLVAGTYVFRLTVTDNNGATGFDEVTVFVNPAPNQAPTANAGSNISLTLPTNSTTLTGSGTDPDGTISTYAWTRVSGPTTFTLGAPNAAVTPLSNLVAGVYVFRLTVTDNNGATATDDVTVTVNDPLPSNQAPIAVAGNNITLNLPANSTSLNGSASSDPDGTIMTYAWSWVSGPATYTIVSPASKITALNNLVAGTYIFKLTVTDNMGGTDEDNIIVIVSSIANQPPVANAGNNITITLPVNSTNLNGGSSTDADGTILTYAWVRVSGPTTYTIVNPAASATGLNGLVAGTYVFRLTVTDNDGASSTDDITVTVNPASNLAPTANAGSDITMTLPINSTILTGSGYDPDGTIQTYAWTRVSGPTTFTIVNPASASTSLNGLVAGTYVFKLTVTDNNGATATDNVTIIVNAATVPTNQLPTANAGSDVTMTLPINSTILTGSGYDPDGTIQTYAWSKVSGPTSFTIVNAGAAATGLNGLVQGTYVFKLTVTDNSGATASDNVTVIVNPASNLSPTANAGADITLTLPANSTTLFGSGSDPDGTIQTYTWTRVSGPTTFTLANATAMTTGLSNLAEGVYVFRLTVTDNSGATASDNITVTVNAASVANLAPIARTDNDIVLTLPVNTTPLHGNTSSDPDGVIASYAWTQVSGPGQATITNGLTSIATVSDLTTGIYVFQLKVTDNKGATSTKTIKVTVQNQHDTGGTLTIYPNPTIGTLNMQYTENANGKIRISIYDANRRLMRDEMVDKTQVSISKAIDVSGFGAGVYFIEVITADNAKEVKQFVKM